MTNILRIVLPFTVWIIGFSSIYALQGLACSRHWPGQIEPRTTLIVAAGLFVLLQGAVLALLATRRPSSRFVQATAMTLAAAALAAAAWSSLPVLTLTVCN